MARNQVRLDIEHREPFAGGGSFGNTGSYERLYGKAHFAIDPDEKGLPSIVDLDLVPRKAQVLVEFAATLDIIKPVEPGRRNRRILYEFSNRGLMGFNYGRGADMSKPEYAGDSFLMRQGYTLMWSGWQGDLIDRGDNVVAYLPLALKDGQPLRGRVRQELNAMAEGLLSMGVSAGAERSQDVQPYPVLDRSTATLTMREYESDPLVIHLHTEGDYWVRHVSLTHTDPRDGSDVEIPEKVGICRSRTELSSHVEHIRAGRTAQDLLYEILLKSGFPLTTPVEPLQLAGKTVYSVADGALFLCLDQALTLDVIRAMAEHKPERVVCLDAGFAGNDQLKANAAQIFKTRGVTSFKTV